MARDVTDDNYYMASKGKIPVKWTAPEVIFLSTTITSLVKIFYIGTIFSKILSSG